MQSFTEPVPNSYGQTVFEAFQSKNLQSIGMVPIDKLQGLLQIIEPQETPENIQKLYPEYRKGIQQNKEYLSDLLTEGEQQGIEWSTITLEGIEVVDMPDSIFNVSNMVLHRSIEVTISSKEQQFVIKIVNAIRYDGNWYLGGNSVGGLILEKI
ncbi:hypothetical protein GCM10022393_34350 [Aquimarina addita]|uniref:Uncharacterized protein n=2 Tax=Aquimarina addita TaxID=870485 RepID=A0ABP6UTT7_9FLAO